MYSFRFAGFWLIMVMQVTIIAACADEQTGDLQFEFTDNGGDGHFDEWLSLSTDEFLGETPFMYQLLDHPFLFSEHVGFGQAFFNPTFQNRKYRTVDEVFTLSFDWSKRNHDGTESVVELSYSDVSAEALIAVRRYHQLRFAHVTADVELGASVVLQGYELEFPGVLSSEVELDSNMTGVGPHIGFRVMRSWLDGLTLEANSTMGIKAGKHEYRFRGEGIYEDGDEAVVAGRWVTEAAVRWRLDSPDDPQQEAVLFLTAGVRQEYIRANDIFDSSISISSIFATVGISL